MESGLSLAGKNSPCPCGSGKKYKRCCYQRHETLRALYEARSAALGQVVDWLLRQYSAETLKSIDDGFFGCIEEQRRPILQEMPERMRDILMNNAYEWLLIEGDMVAHGIPRPVREVVLGPDAPPLLGVAEREWLERAVASPLGAYEVVEVYRGLGCTVRDLAGRSDPVTITEPATGNNFRRGDILGLRLVRSGDVWERSSAAYGFDSRSVPDIEDGILRARSEATDPDRQAWAEGASIRQLWTDLLFQSFEDSAVDRDLESGEDEPAVN